MFEELNGPSKQYTLSVGTGSIVKVELGGSPFEERKVVSLQSEDGAFRVYFAGDSAPSLANVTDDGFKQPRNSLRSYEASPTQDIYLVSITGTINVKVAERA